MRKCAKKLFLLSLIVFFLLQGSTLKNECDGNPLGHNVYKGYCDSWGRWVPGYISNDTWMTPAPEYISGKREV